MGIEHIVYPRPEEEFIYVKKQPVDEKCPECGSANVMRYPVVTYKGPLMVVKCQDCFYRLRYEKAKSEENWPPYQPVSIGWPCSRAG